MEKPLSKEEQLALIELAFSNVLALTRHLVTKHEVFSLAPNEIEAYVETNLSKLISLRHVPRQFEIQEAEGKFKVLDFERGISSQIFFGDRKNLIPFLCKNTLGLIPKYKDAWT